MSSIKELYEHDYNKEDYEAAMVYLWEYYCKWPNKYIWPPLLQDIEDEIKRIREARIYANERR